jgi:hypothetical protein
MTQPNKFENRQWTLLSKVSPWHLFPLWFYSQWFSTPRTGLSVNKTNHTKTVGLRTKLELSSNLYHNGSLEEAGHALSPCLSPLWSCKNSRTPELQNTLTGIQTSQCFPSLCLNFELLLVWWSYSFCRQHVMSSLYIHGVHQGTGL